MGDIPLNSLRNLNPIHQNVLEGIARNREDREARARKILESRLCTNWRDEFGSIQYVQEKPLSKAFPYYAKAISLFSNSQLKVLTFVLVVFNTGQMIAMMSSCAFLLYGGAYQSTYLSGLLIPILLLVIYLLFLRIWQSYEDVFNTMMIYLSDTSHETSLSGITYEPESKLLYAIVSIVAPLIWLTFMIYSIISTATKPQPKCNGQIYGDGGVTILQIAVAILLWACYFLYMTLYKIATVSYNLVKVWKERIIPLEHLNSADLAKINTSDSEKGMSSCCTVTAVALRNDAYQRYLLIRHFMTLTSQHWSFLLSLILAVTVIIFVWYIYYAIVSQWGFAQNILLWFMCAIVGFFFPVACIAYTNSAMNELITTMRCCVPAGDKDSFDSDYQVIGGREEWLAYFDSVPLHWEVYGFAITPRWLQAFVLGALSLVSVTLLPLFMGSLAVGKNA